MVIDLTKLSDENDTEENSPAPDATPAVTVISNTESIDVGKANEAMQKIASALNAEELANFVLFLQYRLQNPKEKN